MGTFDKKTVYHSALRAASEQHGLWIAFLDRASGSRYGKPRFNVGDDQTIYNLEIENERIRAHLETVPLNVWLLVKAHDSKEDAYLEITDEADEVVPEPESGTVTAPAKAPPAGKPAGKPAPAAQQSQAKPATPPARPSGGPQIDNRTESLGQVALRALFVSHEIVEAYKAKFGEEPTEAVRTIAAGLSIEFHRNQGRIPIARPRQDNGNAEQEGAE
jgi:hypothetical protein